MHIRKNTYVRPTKDTEAGAIKETKLKIGGLNVFSLFFCFHPFNERCVPI